MAGKLNDKQVKKLIADRADGLSMRQLAKKYHVSTTTVQNKLKSDPELTQKVTQKKNRTPRTSLHTWRAAKTLSAKLSARRWTP